MGKMKELYMRIHFPYEDYEREYLFDDILSQEEEYLEYLRLQKDPEMNTIHSKIEVEDGERETRIQVHQEVEESNRNIEKEGIRL